MFPAILFNLIPSKLRRNSAATRRDSPCRTVFRSKYRKVSTDDPCGGSVAILRGRYQGVRNEILLHESLETHHRRCLGDIVAFFLSSSAVGSRSKSLHATTRQEGSDQVLAGAYFLDEHSPKMSRGSLMNTTCHGQMETEDICGMLPSQTPNGNVGTKYLRNT